MEVCQLPAVCPPDCCSVPQSTMIPFALSCNRILSNARCPNNLLAQDEDDNEAACSHEQHPAQCAGTGPSSQMTSTLFAVQQLLCSQLQLLPVHGVQDGRKPRSTACQSTSERSAACWRRLQSLSHPMVVGAQLCWHILRGLGDQQGCWLAKAATCMAMNACDVSFEGCFVHTHDTADVLVFALALASPKSEALL